MGHFGFQSSESLGLMLSGSTALGLSKLQVCFHKANELIRLGNQTCSDETATETNLCQQHLVAKELAQHLACGS